MPTDHTSFFQSWNTQTRNGLNKRLVENFADQASVTPLG